MRPASSSSAPLLIAIVLRCRCSAAPPSASAWAPEGSATIHPGVMTFTERLVVPRRRLAVHGELRLHRRLRQRLPRAGGALLLDRRRHRNERLHRRNRCRSARRSTPATSSTAASRTARMIGTLAYNSWIAMQKRKEKDAEHVRLQRPRADQDRPAPGRRKSTRPCRSGAGPTASPPASPSTGEPGLHLRQLDPAPRRQRAQPEDRRQPRRQEESGGWSQQVYTVTPGHPGRLGQRLHGRQRQRARRALDGRVRAACRQQRRRHARQGARLRQHATGLGLRSRRARRRSTRVPVPPAEYAVAGPRAAAARASASGRSPASGSP